MGFEPMNTEVAALPLNQTWAPLHVFDASRARTYNTRVSPMLPRLKIGSFSN